MEPITEKKFKTTVYEDNKAAINIAKTEESKTFKHLTNLHYHYVKDLCADDLIDLVWIETTKQEADFFTKALASNDFIKFRNQIMKVTDDKYLY